jgi:hypothetical protein
MSRKKGEYSPEDERLQEYKQLIETEAVEVNQLIEQLIADAKRDAPDLMGQNITLVPRKRDADLKRIMKPEIDSLIDRTREILLGMRGEKTSS